MAVLNEWFFPKGTLADDTWECVVGENVSGWRHTGLHVSALGADRVELAAADLERLFVPLSGSFRIGHEGGSTILDGRECVFDGSCDVLFVGAGEACTVQGSGRIAIAEARTSVRKPSRYIAREAVPIELRGAGRDSRQVHDLASPDTLDADALIVFEVITPAGNWSSHPGHKHDAASASETELEEIYYFEVAPTRGLDAPADADPFGNFATYSSSAGEIETRALVRTGDVALVPFGYHGPASAAPEYDMYYLNVMAGPQRGWLFSDDPSQTWIRSTWRETAVDPRLPYQAVTKTERAGR